MPNQTPKPLVPEVRKGQGDMQIPEAVFRERLRERFYDPAFERARDEVEKVIDIAWNVYREAHKSPTAGKDPAKAKELELRGWPYPRHLQGRAYSVVVHGDAEGAGTLRRSLSDWLADLQLVSAGHVANFDRYIGYYQPYATSHDMLDEDAAIHEEVRNAARALMGKVRELRGDGKRFDARALQDPRPK